MVDVSPHHIIQFQAALQLAASQTVSRLSKIAKVIPVTGEKHAYDGLGIVEASKVNGLYQPVKFANIQHLRRALIGEQFIVALPVDEKDVVQKLIDPSGDYAKRAMEAMKREMDRVVYNAAFAAVLTGKDMSTSVTAANDGVLTVNATAGLTKEKLDEINENFIDNDVSIEAEQSTLLGISGEEHTDLMGELEFISADFSNDKPATTGSIKKANGMEIALFAANATNPILAVSSSVRDCIAAVRDSIILGIWQDMSVKVQERTDLITTNQIVVTMYIGAVRAEGVRIQKVQTTVS